MSIDLYKNIIQIITGVEMWKTQKSQKKSQKSRRIFEPKNGTKSGQWTRKFGPFWVEKLDKKMSLWGGDLARNFWRILVGWGNDLATKII